MKCTRVEFAHPMRPPKWKQRKGGVSPLNTFHVGDPGGRSQVESIESIVIDGATVIKMVEHGVTALYVNAPAVLWPAVETKPKQKVTKP